ncbi:DUF418 domain-containing protein [Spongiivirga sp. MCCC 1A20706]|uniref:DUF418 domain-containing protein n=1 Tax=Spongiivirga sp. MCCC 1A20706 TaxID=3160963 RepID=UPI0039777EAA
MKSVNTKRIQSIDALRGFALAGIVLVHMVENYIGGPIPPEAAQGMSQGILDDIVSGFLGFFFIGKFFALFSFLFGLSFFIQMDNAAKKNQKFGGRFLWRLVILFVIGYTHHLFYRGDILTVYATFGMVLIPFYNMSSRWILISAFVIFLGVFRFGIYAINGADSIFSGINLSPEIPEVALYFETIKNGSIFEVFKLNAVQGQLMKLDFQLGVFGRGYNTFGFFLLGLFAGKIGLFNNLHAFKSKMKKWLIRSSIILGGLVVTVLIITVIFFRSQNGDSSQQAGLDSWGAMVGITLYDIVNILLTLIIIFSFCLLFLKPKSQRFFLKFSSYGRMALSNYVLQSIIGTFLLYGWGLGYLGDLRNIYTFLIAIVIIILQILASNFWLKHFHFGPLEWLWRSLTYFKRIPLKK